ncbi:reprolysin-like metallopeptidase [Patescibacteria group bacterium]
MFYRILICSILIILAVGCFFIGSVNAQTTVSQSNDCHYQIKVKIVFDFIDQQSQEQADFLIDKWQQGMDSVWNAQSSESFALGCTAKYLFDLQKMKKGTSCADYAEYHCIEVIAGDYNIRGNIADASLSIANQQENSHGQWAITAGALNAAHEVGHMMGLDEDYHYEGMNGENRWVNDNYKNGRVQSIMAQTWGSVTAFAEHSRQIISQAGFEIKPIAINLVQPVIGLAQVDYYSSPAGPRIYADRISPQELAGKLIKGESDSAVYLVDSQGDLRWVSSEKVALDLFGLNWSEHIIWFSDSIIFTYQFTDPIH